jgi:hypothetical protein
MAPAGLGQGTFFFPVFHDIYYRKGLKKGKGFVKGNKNL